MIVARAGSGWQTIFADLCLILFMVTSAALANSADIPPEKPAQGFAPSARSVPLAVYRTGPGAPALGQWLSQQGADPRQQLTIIAHYLPGQQSAAFDQARALADKAGTAGFAARILVEPGSDGTIASLAYDPPDRQMAHGLQDQGKTH